MEVLGTHFNINAYTEEPVVKTTLLEGAVNVHAGDKVVNIHPGEQAVLNEGNSMSVSSANTSEAVAWVQGNFMFNRQELATIMRSISRWYGTEVTYEDNISSKKFTGTISRYGNVSGVLEMMELTGLVHFKVEGRRITVMK